MCSRGFSNFWGNIEFMYNVGFYFIIVIVFFCIFYILIKIEIGIVEIYKFEWL